MIIEKYKNFYMGVAELAAQQSVAHRLKVGCCIVTASGAIYSGWNGTYPGFFTNECEEENPEYDGFLDKNPTTTRVEVIHAEANALNKMLSEGVSSKGSVVFSTHTPCKGCALLLIGAKVRRVFCRDTYRSLGTGMLYSAGIDLRIGV